MTCNHVDFIAHKLIFTGQNLHRKHSSCELHILKLHRISKLSNMKPRHLKKPLCQAHFPAATQNSSSVNICRLKQALNLKQTRKYENTGSSVSENNQHPSGLVLSWRRRLLHTAWRQAAWLRGCSPAPRALKKKKHYPSPPSHPYTTLPFRLPTPPNPSIDPTVFMTHPDYSLSTITHL